MPVSIYTTAAVALLVATAGTVRASFAGPSIDVGLEADRGLSRAVCDAKLVADARPNEFLHRSISGPHVEDDQFMMRRPVSPGIEYRIAASTKATLLVHAFTGFDAAVTFAAGRGRLDMLNNPASPALVAEGVSVAVPLATAGDYYLFDSTAFILVRPRLRTFSTFVIDDHEFNYDERRIGWPNQFVFIPNGALKIDTLAANDASRQVIRHEPTHIYWILKMGHTAPQFPANAIGRLSIDDAPPGEGGVARWIGPTEVLSDMAQRGAVVDDERVELNSYVPLYPPQRSSIDIGMKQNIDCLRTTEVDLATLVLPRDFKESAWPGFQNVAGRPKLTDRDLQKWRAVPRGE